MKDNLLEGIQESDHDKVQYHVNTCYPRYLRLKERAEKRVIIEEPGPSTTSIFFSPESQQITENRPKGRKLEATVCMPPAEKPCIVCNHKKSKGDSRRFRTCEARRACLFLFAIKFNKEAVYTRCALLESCGDVYAADIMYHKNCLSNYLRKFERDFEEIINASLDCRDGIEMTKLLQEFLKTINIRNNAYP